jgi:hypothetical protein
VKVLKIEQFFSHLVIFKDCLWLGLNCVICIVLYAPNCEVDVLLYCFGCYCYCRLSGGEFGLGTWPLRLQCFNYSSDTKCKDRF